MKKKKFVLIFLGILSGLNIFAWIAVWELGGSGGLEVTFFDVGQGDSIFIQTAERKQIIIDGGPDNIILEKLAKVIPFWDRTIDLIVLSHPEADHMTGLIEILKRYEVKNILWTGVKRNNAEYDEWVKLIEKEKNEEGARIIIGKAGNNLTEEFGLSILHPFEDWEGKELKDSNMTSLVVRLVLGENSFLFTGDILDFQEREMILRGVDLDSDVLKIGHHGSKTSSSEEFLINVSPSFSIISAGKDNSYGHPHQEVLARLKKYDIDILRTDKNGDIKILSDGKNLQFKFQN